MGAAASRTVFSEMGFSAASEDWPRSQAVFATYHEYHLSASGLECPLWPANKGVGEQFSSIEAKQQRCVVQVTPVKLQSMSAASGEAFGFSWWEDPGVRGECDMARRGLSAAVHSTAL